MIWKCRSSGSEREDRGKLCDVSKPYFAMYFNIIQYKSWNKVVRIFIKQTEKTGRCFSVIRLLNAFSCAVSTRTMHLPAHQSSQARSAIQNAGLKLKLYHHSPSIVHHYGPQWLLFVSRTKMKQESPADAGIPARRKNDEKNSSISKL